LLVSQHLREQRQHQQRRVPLEQRDFRRGRQADVSPQTVPRLEPGAGTPFAAPEQETVKGGAKEPQLRQERDLGEHRWIINRKEAEWLEEGGCPGDTLLLSHQPGGEREQVGNQEVRPICCCQGVLVSFSEDRHHVFTDDKFAPRAPVHAAPHQIGAGFRVGVVRPHGPEADAQRLDLLPVGAACGDHGLVAPCPQAEGDGDKWVQVAQRAERREDDPPPAGTRTRFGWGHSTPPTGRKPGRHRVTPGP
jgi:hypothetical protein